MNQEITPLERNKLADQEIIDKVNLVLEESFEINRDKLRPEAHIFTDLGLDSLDIVDLVAALQKSFGIKIRDEAEIRDIRTVRDIYNFIAGIKNR